MNYHEWQTKFDEMKRLVPQAKRLTLKETLNMGANAVLRTRDAGQGPVAELERLAQDYLWVVSDKPYYNILPKMVPHLCGCKLDKIPSSYLEVPGGFDAANIRFTETHPLLAVSKTEYVRSILITKSMMNRMDVNERCKFFNTGSRPSFLSQQNSTLTIRVDLGDRGFVDSRSYVLDWVVVVRRDPHRSINEVFRECVDVGPERISTGTRRKVAENCLRLIATVGLIANCPEDNLLEHDVLLRDKQRHKNSGSKQRAKLVANARRRGRIGWNVGTNEMFLGERPLGESRSSGSSRGSHNHAHIRTGHLHAVRFGKGKKQVKIKWFKPTVVRPDLPFDSGDDQ